MLLVKRIEFECAVVNRVHKNHDSATFNVLLFKKAYFIAPLGINYTCVVLSLKLSKKVVNFVNRLIEEIKYFLKLSLVFHEYLVLSQFLFW